MDQVPYRDIWVRDPVSHLRWGWPSPKGAGKKKINTCPAFGLFKGPGVILFVVPSQGRLTWTHYKVIAYSTRPYIITGFKIAYSIPKISWIESPELRLREIGELSLIHI